MCCNYTFIWFVTCYILTSCPIYLIIYCVYNIQNALGKYIYIYLLCCQNVDNSPSQTSRDRWVVPCDLGPDVVDGHYPELIPFFTPVPIPPRCWSISESHIWSVDVRELMCREMRRVCHFSTTAYYRGATWRLWMDLMIDKAHQITEKSAVLRPMLLRLFIKQWSRSGGERCRL